MEATLAPSLIDDEYEQIRGQHELAESDSERSLKLYLQHVVIDARPEPMAWGLCWEPWQCEKIVAPLVPALEFVAGMRPEYSGPRVFIYVLPKGHDKTGLIGRLANGVMAFAKRPTRGTAAASTKEQAGFLLDSMKAEARLNPWIDKRLDTQRDVIHGLASGSTIKVISADADHSSGLKSDLYILDELTFWPDKELFDTLFSHYAKRPGSVFVIITNAGMRGSWQHEFVEKAKADPAVHHVYEAPERQTLASWISQADIAAMCEHISPNRIKRVIWNMWVDATETPLLPYDLIKTCHSSETLWKNGVAPNGSRPELFIGFDVGRTKHRSAIWTWELVGDVLWCREIKVMHNASFSEQKTEFENRISRRVVAARIDKGGIGMQLAEEMEEKYPGIVEGVALGETRQGQLGMAMKAAFQSGKVRIPPDPELASDLMLVDEIDTGSSGVPKVKTNEGLTGHADRFWAGALGLFGAPLLQEKKPKFKGLRPGHGVRV